MANYPNNVQCFLLTPSGLSERSLRRYKSSDVKYEAHPLGYHNAKVEIGTFPSVKSEEGYESCPEVSEYANDSRWPRSCVCGYVFTHQDEYQVKCDEIYNSEQGPFTLKNAPPGAVYDAWWMARTWKGEDGKGYTVILPDGSPWAIDGPCNNCTKPDDNIHKCWCRHGEVPNFTVDKNCNTCSAGVGSIDSGKWHGFLTNGVLHT